MGLESASYVNSLVTTNPIAGDKRERGDDHLRLIKTAVKGSLPYDLRNVSAPAVDDLLTYTAANGGGFANITRTALLGLADEIFYKTTANSITDAAAENLSFSTVLKDTDGTNTLPLTAITFPWVIDGTTGKKYAEIEIWMEWAGILIPDPLDASFFNIKLWDGVSVEYLNHMVVFEPAFGYYAKGTPVYKSVLTSVSGSPDLLALVTCTNIALASMVMYMRIRRIP